MTPPLKLEEGSHSMVDLLIVTPISMIEPRLKDHEDVVSLSEYKFDRSLMVMVK